MVKARFCPYCGARLDEGARFCKSCGEGVHGGVDESKGKESPTDSAGERKTVYAGTLYKCPHCGEILESFTAVCPACGFELRGAKATSAVREFAQKLEAIESRREDSRSRGVFAKIEDQNYISKTDEQKIDLIKNFAVPNTKEDILEFMILATSNIDTSIYATDAPTASAKAMSDAWMSKIKQTYAKAKSTYWTDPDFKKIQELFDSCHTEIKGQKKKKVFRWLMMIGWLPLLFVFCIIAAVVYAPKMEAEEIARLETIAVDVQNALEQGEYKLALMYADSIDYQRMDSAQEKYWDIQRRYWIDKVLAAAEEVGVVIDYTVAPR